MKRNLAIGMMMTALWLLAGAALAADIDLGDGCGLAEAIAAANSDRQAGGCAAGSGADSITLTGDISLDEDLPAIASAIAIQGDGYAIEAAGMRVFQVLAEGELALLDLTISGGGADEHAAPCREAEEEASDEAEESEAPVYGGAVCLQGGMLNVSNSLFQDNASLDMGGAIFSQGGAVDIRDTIFAGNHATSGGAISIIGGSVTISASEFIENTAAEHGGALYNAGGAAAIDDSQFSGNQAAQYGGAIDNIADGSMSVKASLFDGNTATTGGAIGNWRSGLLVIDSAFQANQAENGGAIQNEEGQPSICQSAFSANLASNYGSAIYNVRGRLSVADSGFTAQGAGQGGVIHIIEPEVAQVSLSGNSFADNAGADCVGCENASGETAHCQPEALSDTD